MTTRFTFVVTAIGLAAVVAGCQKPSEAAKPAKGGAAVAENDHGEHGPGPHGGTVIEFGRYHGEFCVDHAKKQATVYILDGNVRRAVPIAVESLLLSITSPTFQVDLKPQPQDGDGAGKASRFVATHDNFGKEQEFAGTVSGVIDGKPYAGDFKEEAHKEGGPKGTGRLGPMHTDGVARSAKSPEETEAERKLYLTPGGIYTAADIKANGGQVAPEKYRTFKASHDLNPKPGDKLCPITLTKASEKLSWVIGGQTYYFCCMPCVDEYVSLAKTSPAEVKKPNEFIKK